jgi:hypothetical protein
MDIRKLNADVWDTLDPKGNKSIGYRTILLADGKNHSSSVHIFRDEGEAFHLVIEVGESFNEKKLVDPNVNGLSVSITTYILDANATKRFVDILCSHKGYLMEFTQVAKEICFGILVNELPPLAVINEVVRKWISFWNTNRGEVFSEEQIIGLMCELDFLRILCQINPAIAVNSWSGPTRERHDFIFSTWTFEVKGTRRNHRTHTIGDIDQLKPFPNKSLGFVSYMVAICESPNSLTLPRSISLIYELLKERPEIMVRFNSLLAEAGYSPVDKDYYERIKVDLLEAALFIVDENFPRLTTQFITAPHLARISSITYDISLAGLQGTRLYENDWGNIFDG